MLIGIAPPGQVATYECRLVSEYLTASSRDHAGTVDRAGLARLIENLARGLELVLAGGAVIDVAMERGARCLRDVDAVIAGVTNPAEFLCVRHPREIIEEHERWLKEAAAALAATPTPPETSLEAVRDVYLLGGRIAADLPVDGMARLADELGVSAWGHRLRLAHEAIRAFLRRHDPQRDHRIALIGRAYAAGKLSLEEAAGVSGLDPWDLIAELEAGHFCRPLSTISLDPAQRAALLVRIRAERLRGPVSRGDLAAREVIASQRIEGIDARPWVNAGGG